MIGSAALAATRTGTKGPDRLTGTKGGDLLDGRRGHDLLVGGDGNDRLIGGRGPDVLRGGPGHDEFGMNAGEELRSPGADRIHARDGGTDEINCGTGHDVAIVDFEEDGVYDCEELVEPGAMIARPQDHSSNLAAGRARRPGGSRAARGGEPGRALAAARVPRRARPQRPASRGWRAVLPAERLVTEAARAAAKNPFPAPRDLPIDTFVVLMMENRSFDHYFGWHPPPTARTPASPIRTSTATSTRPTGSRPDFQGCDFRDPDHGWKGGRHQFNRGALDGFFQGNEDGHRQRRVRARLLPEGGPRLHPARRRRLHPLRPLLLLAHGVDLPQPPLPDRRPERGPEDERAADRRRPERRLHLGDDLRPGAQPRALGRLLRQRPAGAGALRRSRARAGCGRRRTSTPTPRPERCRTSPSSTRRSCDGGGGNGLSADEHPHGDVRLGQAFMSDIVHAFVAGPQYKRGALFVNYDEWGGFFDHVAPEARPRRARQPKEPRRGLGPDRLPDPRGRRLALRPGGQEGRPGQPHDLHARVDPEADLLPLRARLPEQAPPLRVEHRPQLRLLEAADIEPPPLPDPAAILATPCAFGGSSAAAEGARPGEAPDLRAARQARLRGPAPTYESLFREPDRMRKAFASSTEKGP